MITRDVKSLLDVQRSLRDFMRHESVTVVREINQVSVDRKLLILEFLVRAFAIIGDLEVRSFHVFLLVFATSFACAGT